MFERNVYMMLDLQILILSMANVITELLLQPGEWCFAKKGYIRNARLVETSKYSNSTKSKTTLPKQHHHTNKPRPYNAAVILFQD